MKLLDLKLSKIQIDCIRLAISNSNKLVRYKQSTWSSFDAGLDKYGIPLFGFRNGTIKALLDRGLMLKTDFMFNPDYRREVFMSVELVEIMLNPLNDYLQSIDGKTD